MRNLVISKYLQIIPHDIDYAVYHSLFSNLTLLDAEGIRFLETFRHPNSIENAIEIFYNYDPSVIWSLINNLRLKNFLVWEDCDEYELFETNSRSRRQFLKSGYLIRNLQLVLSNRCNFKCKYCFVDTMYNSKERSEYQKSLSNMQMSFDIAKQAVEKFIALGKKNGNRHLFIEFFGGEPLINWPVIASVLNLFKNDPQNGVNIHYSITTNGYLITEEMAELFRRYNVTITISFDAPSQHTQAITAKEKGCERVKESLAILQRKCNYVTFNSVISRETINDYNGVALVDIAKLYNVAMIGLILDLDLEFYNNELNRKKVIKELWSTSQYGQSLGIPIVGYWRQVFDQIVGKQPLFNISGYKTCPATGCKLSVEPEGHIFICKCCSGYIGNISEFDEVLSSPKYETYAMRVYSNSIECRGCEIEGFCSGVCMGALEKKYSRLNIIEKSSCEIFKGITRKFLENMSTTGIDSIYLYPRIK